MPRVLLTGACGFIGSHFVEAMLKDLHGSWQIVGLDRIDETSTLERVRDTDAYRDHHERFGFVWHDLRAPINAEVSRAIGEVDLVIHLAAGTHVDRSITNPCGFVADNVVGTCHLLEWVRSQPDPPLTLHFSTDEVFGEAPGAVAYVEDDRFRPRNPYAATKAGAVLLADSYANTYGLPILTTMSMNVIGERQSAEKVVPKFTRQILTGETVIIHADPTKTLAATRSYIHARNVWNAVRFVIEHGTPGERYNITGDRELDALELAQMIAQILDRPLHAELVDFHSDRPGHDLRYALSGRKLAAMGHVQPVTFTESLTKTVRWFAAHPQWLGLPSL